MVYVAKTKLCNIQYGSTGKILGKFDVLCFYHLSFLKYSQSLNPTSQIPNNFHAKPAKIDLLITFDREML